MANSINRAIILGNLGQDPDIRKMSNGDPVATFSVATSERWKDKQTGEMKESTEWHRVVVFNSVLVDVVERMLQKGTKVYVEGQLKTRKWQNQAGQDQYTTEIILSGFNGQLVVCSGGKASGNTPPPVDENPFDGRGNADVLDEAINTMNNVDDDSIPF